MGGGLWPPVRSSLAVGLNTDPVAAKRRDVWWFTRGPVPRASRRGLGGPWELKGP
jgi:hypothetical protein